MVTCQRQLHFGLDASGSRSSSGRSQQQLRQEGVFSFTQLQRGTVREAAEPARPLGDTPYLAAQTQPCQPAVGF